MSEWRDIESAPKDGSVILLGVFSESGFLYPTEAIWCGYWDVDSPWLWYMGKNAPRWQGYFGRGKGRLNIEQVQHRMPSIVPTHWQPLPEPPHE